jgi:hypothetical protein
LSSQAANIEYTIYLKNNSRQPTTYTFNSSVFEYNPRPSNTLSPNQGKVIFDEWLSRDAVSQELVLQQPHQSFGSKFISASYLLKDINQPALYLNLYSGRQNSIPVKTVCSQPDKSKVECVVSVGP